MIAREDAVTVMLRNGKPVGQIIAESGWTRRNVQALARSLQMLIHPDTGVAYDPRTGSEIAAAAAETPAPADASHPLQPRPPRQECVHDRLIAYGLQHSRQGIRATAERVRRDMAMIAAALQDDRNRAAAYEARVAARQAAQKAPAYGANSPTAHLMSHARDIARARGVELSDIRDWCRKRGLCGATGMIAGNALDQYADAHPVQAESA
jgi:pyruvate/2-oxoglutarate dehydrogenase complex dihydrolipoamide acyltransferase (E2) component